MGRKSFYPSAEGQVEVTSNGRTYTANWGIASGMVTVWHPMLGSKSTQIGGHAAGGEEVLARRLLSELIADSETPSAK